jgi:hypothetical protein
VVWEGRQGERGRDREKEGEGRSGRVWEGVGGRGWGRERERERDLRVVPPHGDGLGHPSEKLLHLREVVLIPVVPFPCTKQQHRTATHKHGFRVSGFAKPLRQPHPHRHPLYVNTRALGLGFRV